MAIANVSYQNQAALPEGSATIDLAKTWNQWLDSGYKRNGSLRIYWQKDWGTQALISNVQSVDSANQQTTLLITQSQHGANTGDRVTFSNLSATTVHGLAKSLLETTHTITYKDANAYFITVPAAVTSSGQATFTANANMRYLECDGTQSVQQGPAGTIPTNLLINGQKATGQANSVTTTHLKNCSPLDSSYTAYKYFKDLDSGLKTVLGEEIEGGTFSVANAFNLPSGVFKSSDQGSIGSFTVYTNRSRALVDAQSSLSYEVLRHTTQTVLLAMKTQVFEQNGALRTTTTDLYGKDPTAAGVDYALLRSTVVYNNIRKTEVVIDYTADFTKINPSYQSDSGTIRGVTKGDPPWTWFVIDVTPFLFGGTLQIDFKMGSGNMAASYQLTAEPPLTPNGPPNVPANDPLPKAVDVNPGTTTTLTHVFKNNLHKKYYLGVQGAPQSPAGASNSYYFDAWIKE